MQQMNRRELLSYLRNLLITAAGAPLVLPARLQAQLNKDDHYFIFVELKGGVHHLIGTDYPDPQELATIAKEYPSAVLGFAPEFAGEGKSGFLTDWELDEAWKQKINQGIMKANALFKLNGYCAALPYALMASGEKNSHYAGTTHGGRYRYCLGWSGLPLAALAGDISVLRSVYMLADFHGRANKEIYSGNPDGVGAHIAGILTKLLAEKYGRKPLDNLVLDGAAYESANSEAAAIKLSFQALNALAQGTRNKQDSNFSHLQVIARAMLQQDDLQLHSDTRMRLNQYLQALTDADQVRDSLSQAGVGTGDLSLNLRVQLDSSLALIRSGMTRVVTVCMGQKNATNKVDPFGLFDSHSGIYHGIDSNSGSSTQHHITLRATLQAIADFINDLKQNPAHAPYRDKITLVVGSEFGRTANFFGNENNPKGGMMWPGALGNGHYYFNNNYLFFGKGVRRGVWLGQSEPITRYPWCVDFTKLNAGNRAAYIDPIEPQSRSPHGKGTISLHPDFAAGTVSADSPTKQGMAFTVVHQRSNPKRRAFMAKDVVKTIMAIAGHDIDTFHGEHYRHSFYDDAQLIKPLLS